MLEDQTQLTALMQQQDACEQAHTGAWESLLKLSALATACRILWLLSVVDTKVRSTLLVLLTVNPPCTLCAPIATCTILKKHIII